MKKVVNWIKNNKGLTFILILTLILLAVMGVIFAQMLSGGDSNVYGNRLDGIDDVKISDETYSEVEEEVMATEVVEKVDVRLQGKIVYTTIVLKSDTTSDRAKEIASATLDNYSEEELKFYDFSYFLKWTREGVTIVIAGNKHHDNSAISWIKN